MSDEVKQGLAIKVINLRKALAVANSMLREQGCFGILPGEDDGPSFREGRNFWKQVRKLTLDNGDAPLNGVGPE
jgi:hypothetical protein